MVLVHTHTHVHTHTDSHAHTLSLKRTHARAHTQSLATLAITSNAKDAYKLVLVDTPLAAYMSMNFNEAADFTELNIEVYIHIKCMYTYMCK